MLKFSFVAFVVGFVTSAVLNGPPDRKFDLSTEDFLYIQHLPKVRAGARLPGFKYLYLEPGGHLTTALNHSRHQLEIAGSPRTSQHSLQVAANVIIKMTSHMPPAMFVNLTRGTVGLFTPAEKLIVFPEFKDLANGNCGPSCNGTGACAHTCSYVGVKLEDYPGMANSRAAVEEDVFLCNSVSTDPNRHMKFNILVHEFSHVIHYYAANAAVKTQILNAYHAAKQHATWTLDSYAMRNEHEYFALATVTFFGVTQEGIGGTGNMNMCGSIICPTVLQSRDHLRSRDPALFNILSHVYTNNNPSFNPGLSICPPGSVVVG